MFSGGTGKGKKSDARTIQIAYSELSTSAFAAWIRMMVATPDEFVGRGAVAQMLDYSETRCNAILRELKLRRYVNIITPARPGLPAKVEIAKRCRIEGRSQFVRGSISNALCSDAEPTEAEDESPDYADTWLDRFVIQRQQPMVFIEPMSDPVFAHSMSRSVDMDGKKSATKKKSKKKREKRELDEFLDKLRPSAPPPAPEKTTKKGGRSMADKSDNKASKSVPTPKEKSSESVTAPRSKKVHGSLAGQSILDSKPRIDLSRIPTKEERRAKRSLSRSLAPVASDVGQPIDWNKFDANDEPIVSFSPDDEERAQLIKSLDSDPRRINSDNRLIRKQLIDKLTREFSRCYERYRRAVLRSKGKVSTFYAVMKEEQKYSERAAIACIRRGVTPTQVFQYWHENIGNFADAKMTVPPLTFLAQPANIDAVSLAIMSGADRPPRSKKKRMASAHPLSDTSLLHPQLRRGLMQAGFDLSDYNDKYLVTIQALALDVAHGAEELRFVPDKLRPMVKWAAKEIYKNVDPADYL